MNRIALFAALTTVLTARACRADYAVLASPMIDTSAFRDGQVRRLAGRYADWSVVCDDIKVLNRRFCSLRSANSRDGMGRVVFVDISTGDDGRPAALLHLPLGLSLRPGIRVGVRHTTFVNRRPPDRRSVLSVTTCSGRECLAVWTLAASDVAALNDGAGLQISFCGLRPAPAAFRVSLANETCEVPLNVTLSGQGFKDAVSAALR